MKTLRIFMAMAAMSASLSCFSQNVVAENEVHVIISGETSRDELSQLRAQLNTVGVDFQYIPTFNSDRMLMGIEVKLVVAGNHSSASNAMLSSPGEYVSFKLSKQDAQFTIDCLGRCEEE